MEEEITVIDKSKCIGETNNAIKVRSENFDEPQWIPKRCIHDDSEVYKSNTSGDLIIHAWFARKKGWE